MLFKRNQILCGLIASMYTATSSRVMVLALSRPSRDPEDPVRDPHAADRRDLRRRSYAVHNSMITSGT